MNDHELDKRLAAALTSRDREVGDGAPPLRALLDRRAAQLRRRSLTIGVASVLGLGVGGMALAAGRGGEGGEQQLLNAADPLPSSSALWECATPPVASTPEFAYFSDCRPVDSVPDTTAVEPTTTTSILVPTPTVVGEPIPHVGPTTLPGEPLAPTTTTIPITGPGASETSYVVQSGDWPLRVADLHCVALDDLVNYNGWATVDEFPFPGTEIRIPPGWSDDCLGRQRAPNDVDEAPADSG